MTNEKSHNDLKFNEIHGEIKTLLLAHLRHKKSSQMDQK
jgi:hypothetical protein